MHKQNPFEAVQQHKQNKLEHLALHVLPILHGISTDLPDLILERGSTILAELRDVSDSISKQIEALEIRDCEPATTIRAKTPTRTTMDNSIEAGGVVSEKGSRRIILPPSPERASKRHQSQNVV